MILPLTKLEDAWGQNKLTQNKKTNNYKDLNYQSELISNYPNLNNENAHNHNKHPHIHSINNDTKILQDFSTNSNNREQIINDNLDGYSTEKTYYTFDQNQGTPGMNPNQGPPGMNPNQGPPGMNPNTVNNVNSNTISITDPLIQSYLAKFNEQYKVELVNRVLKNHIQNSRIETFTKDQDIEIILFIIVLIYLLYQKILSLF